MLDDIGIDDDVGHVYAFWPQFPRHHLRQGALAEFADGEVEVPSRPIIAEVDPIKMMLPRCSGNIARPAAPGHQERADAVMLDAVFEGGKVDIEHTFPGPKLCSE